MFKFTISGLSLLSQNSFLLCRGECLGLPRSTRVSPLIATIYHSWHQWGEAVWGVHRFYDNLREDLYLNFGTWVLQRSIVSQILSTLSSCSVQHGYPCVEFANCFNRFDGEKTSGLTLDINMLPEIKTSLDLGRNRSIAIYSMVYWRPHLTCPRYVSWLLAFFIWRYSV